MDVYILSKLYAASPARLFYSFHKKYGKGQIKDCRFHDVTVDRCGEIVVLCVLSEF